MLRCATGSVARAPVMSPLIPHDLSIVDLGVEHKPHCEEEVKVLLLEPAGTVNTGDNEDGEGRITPTLGEWVVT